MYQEQRPLHFAQTLARWRRQDLHLADGTQLRMAQGQIMPLVRHTMVAPVSHYMPSGCKAFISSVLKINNLRDICLTLYFKQNPYSLLFENSNIFLCIMVP